MQAAGPEGLQQQAMGQLEQQQQGQRLGDDEPEQGEGIGQRLKGKTAGDASAPAQPPEGLEAALQQQPQGQPRQQQGHLQSKAAQQDRPPAELLEPVPLHPQPGGRHHASTRNKQGDEPGKDLPAAHRHATSITGTQARLGRAGLGARGPEGNKACGLKADSSDRD